MTLTDAAERVLDLVADTTAADRSCWLVDNDGPGVGRVTVWWEDPDQLVQRGLTVHRPVIDEIQQAGLIDLSTARRTVGVAGPRGRRVQLTVRGWATRLGVPADVVAAKMRTWKALP